MLLLAFFRSKGRDGRQWFNDTACTDFFSKALDRREAAGMTSAPFGIDTPPNSRLKYDCRPDAKSQDAMRRFASHGPRSDGMTDLVELTSAELANVAGGQSFNFTLNNQDS